MRFAFALAMLPNLAWAASADVPDAMALDVKPSGYEDGEAVMGSLEALLARRLRNSDAQFRAICRGCAPGANTDGPEPVFRPLETLGAERMR